MSESEVRSNLRRMGKEDLMKLLATYTLLEQGVTVSGDNAQLEEVIEQNYMRDVAREDLVVEILNSRERLNIALKNTLCQ